MKEIDLKAPAKINWSLDIVGRRDDGYHLLRSLMQSVSLYDTVRLRKSVYDSCWCSVTFPDGEDNLALHAWRVLKAECGVTDGLSISIEKRIPLAGGLAGGSTDAAAVLLGANRLFDLGLARDQLCRIGLMLGADLPFCLTSGLALIEGIGEIVTPLHPAHTYHLTLVNPGVPVSTAAVYRNFRPNEVERHTNIDIMQAALLSGDKQGLAKYAGNVLEQPAFALQPMIRQLKQHAAGFGLVALMSGSGGTVWLLADSATEAESAAAELGKVYPFTVAVTTLGRVWLDIDK